MGIYIKFPGIFAVGHQLLCVWDFIIVCNKDSSCGKPCVSFLPSQANNYDKGNMSGNRWFIAAFISAWLLILWLLLLGERLLTPPFLLCKCELWNSGSCNLEPEELCYLPQNLQAGIQNGRNLPCWEMRLSQSQRLGQPESRHEFFFIILLWTLAASHLNLST